ncbi:MAG TPA: hypothetical protein VFV09_02410 [Actinomycetota bacterium]|nr:hypothetical protein [Actinomycetota bacterium]
MLLSPEVLQGIVEGTVELAFRCWERPRVKVGTRLRTFVGLVEVLAVDVVTIDQITEEQARLAGSGSRAELVDELSGWSAKGPVHRVRLRFAGPDPRIELRNRGDLSREELAGLKARLERMDRSSTVGPWTRPVLELIQDSPGTRAADLAALLTRETLPFKRDVLKLKELGLTESLEVGYRLSPRGAAYLAATE